MARKPTTQELDQAKSHTPVYKAVRVDRRGRIVSLWVRGTEEFPVVSTDDKGREFSGVTIIYGRGKLSGDGRYGIFCCKDLRSAKIQAVRNGKYSRCRVYRALPIGNEIENTSGFGLEGTVLYPAIILEKRAVWSGWC